MIALAAVGCKKDPSDPKPDPNAQKGNLRIEFEPRAGDAPLILNDRGYVVASGDTVKIAVFNYYVSNITLIKKGGGEEVLPKTYHLIKTNESSSRVLTMSDVPVGEYEGIKFVVGVDARRNTCSANDEWAGDCGAQDGALDPANGMYWSWNSGYIFFKLEGLYARDSVFQYHIGGSRDPHSAVVVAVPDMKGRTFKVEAGRTPELHFYADALEIFKSVSLRDMPKIHMPGEKAAQIAGAYKSMFSLDHIH
ncbi:MAG: hypothetical protein RMM53_02350 [Bacteroidia bacterium]|nr:hypothetical protein [Bacteroidia bacterium]MDW8333036.1 hypothetical protein [Bacteroidia bacterium]